MVAQTFFVDFGILYVCVFFSSLHTVNSFHLNVRRNFCALRMQYVELGIILLVKLNGIFCAKCHELANSHLAPKGW